MERICDWNNCLALGNLYKQTLDAHVTSVGNEARFSDKKRSGFSFVVQVALTNRVRAVFDGMHINSGKDWPICNLPTICIGL